jgi:hypothetical protein
LAWAPLSQTTATPGALITSGAGQRVVAGLG